MNKYQAVPELTGTMEILKKIGYAIKSQETNLNKYPLMSHSFYCR